MAAKSIWTEKNKKWARKELLAIANSYEVKRLKRLVNVSFRNDGSAKYIGKAHDYTVWLPEIK